MNSLRFNARSVPIAFALITILSYGLVLPLTGFYWDDWPFAWIARFLGPAEFIVAFRGFRPFLGPIFFITSSLIPPDPFVWQCFALIVRFLAGLSAWFALDKVWPRQRWQTMLAALLFLIFPGYSQHWVAYTHINQEWIPFIFYLLSFGFTARALRRPSSFLRSTIYALFLLVIGLFPTEYFIGLEPLRSLFIWAVAAEATQSFRSRLITTLKTWWPYLLIWMADLAWLVYYYRSGAYVSYDLTAAQAVPPLAESLLTFADAAWKAGFYVWVQVLVLTIKSISAPTTLLTFALMLSVFLLSPLYLLKLKLAASDPPVSAKRTQDASKPRNSKPEVRDFAAYAIAIGLVGILLGRIPSFAAGLPLTLQSSFDRFMISMMLGSSLFMVGLVELLVPNQRAKTYTFAFLIALGTGQQFFNANIFRRDWQGQQQIYWQLAWRIPALQPHTAIVTQQMPLDYETDLSMTAALNWIYAPQIRPPDLPYALVYSEKRLGGSVLPNLNPGTVMELPYRTVNFIGNTSQVLAIYVPRSGCLRVLDSRLGDEQTYASLPKALTALIPLSNPSVIITSAAEPTLPSPPFQSEPAHEWCYFYEKAELARQEGDWKMVAQLGSQAAQKGLAPQDAFEQLPFIEAQARTGDLVSAEQATRVAWDNTPKIHRGLCLLWDRVQTDGPAEARSLATRLIGGFDCGH